MTKPSPGPSLLQARGSELHPHSLIHRRRHDSIHGHHHHRHQRPHRAPSGTESGETTEQAQAGHETGIDKPSAAANQASVGTEQPSLTDANDLELPDGVVPGKNSVDAVKGVDNSSPTDIVQNASPSPSHSTIPALYLRTAIETSETLLAGPVLGNTVAIPTADSQATAAPPAAVLDNTSDSPAPELTGSSPVVATADVSTAPATTTPDPTPAAPASVSSSQASDLTSTPSSTPSIYPTLVDLRNGTNTIFNGNSSFVPASSASSKSQSLTHLSLNSSPSSLPSLNSSRHRLLVVSSPTVLAFPTSTDELISSTTFSAVYTQSDETSIPSASASTSTSSLAPSDVTSTDSGGDFVATPAAGGAFPPPSTGASANAGDTHGPEPQKVRIIGGVCGSVAGVAFLAVLVLLALKYKKRRDGGALLGGSSRLGSTASGTLTGGDLMAMTERSRISAVPVPFSSLTRKRNSRPPDDSVEQGGERGFYRVAGRKLPPVLITGGDGYSDPRESVMSDGSDYHRGSQAFDLVAAGSPRQLALGAPMRPVSGVPIMRSGPARIPVTENPFVDPSSPPPTQDTPHRRPLSRASASKFHEGI